MLTSVLRLLLLVLLLWPVGAARSQEQSQPKNEDVPSSASIASAISNEPLPKGSRIYVAPISNGFETYITAGIEKKKVPVVIVADRGKADYELTGVSDSDKAGWAKMLFFGSQQTNETASIKIVKPQEWGCCFCLLG
jgi:hypothetical protein